MQANETLSMVKLVSAHGAVPVSCLVSCFNSAHCYPKNNKRMYLMTGT